MILASAETPYTGRLDNQLKIDYSSSSSSIWREYVELSQVIDYPDAEKGIFLLFFFPLTWYLCKF
jgi:hypothetical protein